jgi:hypothetical protein
MVLALSAVTLLVGSAVCGGGAVEELVGAKPGVGAGGGVFMMLDVEEAVRSAGVDLDLVVDAGGGQGLVERVDRAGRDVVVGAAEGPEDRRGELVGVLVGPGPRGPPVPRSSGSTTTPA